MQAQLRHWAGGLGSARALALAHQKGIAVGSGDAQLAGARGGAHTLAGTAAEGRNARPGAGVKRMCTGA